MGKHLSLSDRAIIEKLLAQDYTFAYIARQLGRSSVCISKEVKKHRCFANRYQTTDNDCAHFRGCLRNN
ncbi:Helix-turn-helix domain-containing protein, partial [Ruminococcaceae bacterium YAD3003]